MRARHFIDIHKTEELGVAVAMTNYAGLTGMLVATVQWGAKSIEKSQTPFALEILKRALTEKEKVDNVVKRYNRRFNAKHKKV